MRYQAQRYSDETHIETWVGHLSDYQERHGLYAPTRIEATWVVEGQRNRMPAPSCARLSTISLMRILNQSLGDVSGCYVTLTPGGWGNAGKNGRPYALRDGNSGNNKATPP